MNGNPSGRFIVMDAPEQHPGVDFFTRSPNGPFADMGQTLHILRKNDSKTIERVYVSLDTVRELADAFGLFDGLVPEASETDDYLRGYADAIKENIGADVLDAADRLGFAAERLRDLSRILAAPEPAHTGSDDEDAGEPAAEEREVDPAGAGAEGNGAGQSKPAKRRPARQGANAGRQRRSHDVPGDSGDGGDAFGL